MAYVRQRGSQLAIVHVERDKETGKVQQRILFTIYSKAEALKIIGRKDKVSARYFQDLLTDTSTLNLERIAKKTLEPLNPGPLGSSSCMLVEKSRLKGHN